MQVMDRARILYGRRSRQNGVHDVRANPFIF
jgi:hypothetical protein